ncbi:MAG: T9SS type A sorting domain-containing protein [Crocinitomicaceae bacterium]|nr:T9SS type A sorting domain-containing protein [Crocinitomicaceae bacterium]
MKKILLFAITFLALDSFGQTQIEPFAPSVPGTYIGGFGSVAVLASVPGTTAWTVEGSGTGSYPFVGDDGATVFGYTGSVGNYCAVGLSLGSTLTLVSPEMNFGVNTNNPTLTFKWGQSQLFSGLPGYYNAQQLEVLYKEGSGGSWNVLTTITTIDAAYSWHNEIVDLSAVSDFSALYIGFRVTCNTPGLLYPTFDYGETVIDEIVVTGTSTCTNTTNSFSVNTCGSYTVPSGDETYNTPGTQTVMDTIPNTAGCDSVLTISLTLKAHTANSITETACFSYTVPSGDETYTTVGTQTVMDTIQNVAGCDSVLTINLTINSVDTSLTINTFPITANATGAAYQWLEGCDSSPSSISGETNQSFTPSDFGWYSCEVTQNGCTDTSTCYYFEWEGIDENNQSFDIYPNPSKGSIILDLNSIQGLQTMTIADMNGKIVVHDQINGGSQINYSLNLENGIYIISLVDNEGIIRRSKLIIE